MVSSTPRLPAEGRSSWLAVGVLVLAMLAFDAWVVWAGRSPGRVPGSVSETVFLVLRGGHERTWAPGRLDEGTGVQCVHRGLDVVAKVPAAGRTVTRSVESASAGRLTLVLAHRADGSVRARCLD